MNAKSPIVVLVVAVLAAGVSGAAPAQGLDLSKAPLFLNSAVDPNLLVTFDDSGSMGFGFTPDKVDDGSTTNCSWRYKRFYSSAFNKQYYDPTITYSPPLRSDGSSFPIQSFGSASTNGFSTGAPAVNLGTGYFVTWWEGHTGPRITHNNTATGINCGQGDNSNPKTYRFPTGSASAFYCTLNTGAPNLTADTSYTCQAPTGAEQTNFANWFAYYRYRGNALKSSVSRSFGVLGDDLRVAWQNMNNNPLTAGTVIGDFTGTRRTDFFNWLYASPLSGATPTLRSVIRAGEFFRRSGSSETNPYWEKDLSRELMCRQNFHVLVTDGFWNESSHPYSVLPAANNSIKNNRTLPDGRSFTASASTTGVHAAYVWNEANRVAACSGGGVCTPSYSDLAFHYWATDLRPDLDNKVPAYLPDRTTGVTGGAVDLSGVADVRDVPEIYWNPKNDPATWQHAVQFFIGFGVDGALPYNPTTYENIRKNNQQWPSPRNNDQAGVDDSWHGSLASRGQYFGASNPNEVVDALSNILDSIVQRKGTNTAISVSTGIVSTGAVGYQTVFDSSDWSGSLLSRPLIAHPTTGVPSLGVPLWDAGCKLTGGDCLTTGETNLPTRDWSSSRVILTSSAPVGSSGVPFRFSSLSAEQVSALNDNPTTVPVDNDGKGAQRLEYIRGNRSLEQENGGSFRTRHSVFGAIMHSKQESFIPPTADRYDDNDWPPGSPELTAPVRWVQFADANKTNPTYIGVGANDGSYHVIDASNGEEAFAYVPFAVYRGLGKMTDPRYQFEPTVDGPTAVQRYVYTRGSWRSLLVGTLRRGGQSVFALDVTHANQVTEANASSVVQWEFSDRSAGGADLGYTYGKPFITRLHPLGKWVVMVPGSYNSDEADIATGSGRAVLFVLDAADGTLLRKFDVTAKDGNARGLTGVQGARYESNKDLNEFAYAGDLAGNIWRFDFSAASPSAWTFDKLFDPGTPFVRPITTEPRLAYHPDQPKNYVILVGTGKYIERSDRSTAIPTQAFYGIVDILPKGGTPPTNLIKPADLLTRHVSTSGGLRRVDGPRRAMPPKGWAIEFAESDYRGERVIARAEYSPVGRRVMFPTFIPSGDDPCLPGGKSFVMFVDVGHGGAANDGSAFFDTNGDDQIDAADDDGAVGTLVNAPVEGAPTVLPPGGGIGGVILPGDEGTIVTREFEWRRRAFKDRTELQGED